MNRKNHKNIFRGLLVSSLLAAAGIMIGVWIIEDLEAGLLLHKLLWPLCRLMLLIGIGLLAGQIIEATGWSKVLGALAGPLFRFARLGQRCSSAFAAAFISGAAANAMLLEFYKEEKITRKQLFLTNFVNQFPAYFLHLPTTFFIVIPLTGLAGAIYFIITFLATLLRTVCFLIYGRIYLPPQPISPTEHAWPKGRNTGKNIRDILQGVKTRLPRRLAKIAMYVIPIYTLIFVFHSMGFFDMARNTLANYIVTSFIPVESLSVVVLSFVAEFTSGFAAAGALLDAGVLTIKQTVLALLIGNIIAFPVRALRHQLPRYMGIFSPRTGTQLLLMGQGFRVLSLLIVMVLYYIFS